MLLPQVEEFFSGVRGRECWSIIAGAGTGSVVSLDFGAKVRRQRPSRNRTLSLEERLFKGERSLIVYCDWRFEASGSILCTSQSEAVLKEGRLPIVAPIKNRVVQEIRFASGFHDLQIAFDNGIVFSVFCDLDPEDEWSSNYVMFNPTTCIAAMAKGGLTIENR